MRLDGKVALVTGGSRGIGRAVALELAGRGARLVVNYRGNAEAAEETARAIAEAGGEGMTLGGDVSQAADVERLIQETLRRFGRLDVLVNNAGIARDNLILRMSEADWDAVVDTNLKGAFFCTKHALRSMIRQRSGRIINIASVVGLAGNPGQANYVSAKAGLIGFTKAVAKEVASRGITVNAIAPGFIETDMTRALSGELRDGIVHLVPLGRFGQPAEVAHAVAFLASDLAAYITGQVLNVDGGMVMM